MQEFLVSPASQNKETPREMVDPESVLNLTNISTSKNQQQTAKEELLSSDRLLRVKHLTGLHCNKDTAWSLQILQRLAPFLEEIHLYNFNMKHLQIVATMPQLRFLVLEGGTKEQVKLANDYKFPAENKVEFLWINIPGHANNTLCKAIVSSYQSSLKVLLSSVPTTYHAHVIEFFRSFKMPNLQKLFYFSQYCTDNCSVIMNELRTISPHINVYCFTCGRTDAYDN